MIGGEYSRDVHAAGRRCARRGMTLVEATISASIVGLLLVAALSAVAAAATGVRAIENRGRGALLCAALMEEILAQPYDAGGTPAGSLDRSAFDEISDYEGWSASPPQHPDGTALAGFDDWERQVAIRNVQTSNLGVTQLPDDGVKRILVRALRDGAEVVRLVGFRTEAGYVFVGD